MWKVQGLGSLSDAVNIGPTHHLVTLVAVKWHHFQRSIPPTPLAFQTARSMTLQILGKTRAETLSLKGLNLIRSRGVNPKSQHRSSTKIDISMRSPHRAVCRWKGTSMLEYGKSPRQHLENLTPRNPLILSSSLDIRADALRRFANALSSSFSSWALWPAGSCSAVWDSEAGRTDRKPCFASWSSGRI